MLGVKMTAGKLVSLGKIDSKNVEQIRLSRAFSISQVQFCLNREIEQQTWLARSVDDAVASSVLLRCCSCQGEERVYIDDLDMLFFAVLSPWNCEQVFFASDELTMLGHSIVSDRERGFFFQSLSAAE